MIGRHACVFVNDAIFPTNEAHDPSRNQIYFQKIKLNANRSRSSS